MVADKVKKPKVAEEEEDKEDQIDGALVLSIEKLQEIQDELEKINEEASDKVLEVEQKYNKVRVPIYGKRMEIINAIPDFWLTAFLSHPALCTLLNEEDQKIFKYISSLEVEDSNDVKSGYSITLSFNTNPYFEDKKLTKTYTFLDEGSAKITSTPIKWKEGMGISNGEDTKKKGNKRALEVDSFFRWFDEMPSKDMGDIYDEISDIIKEDLWPNPLNYFNGGDDEAEDLDADEEDDEDDEDDEEDGEEEDN